MMGGMALIPGTIVEEGLAETRGCSLVTTDDKLRDCPGRRCEVHIAEPRQTG
jgi:hypothetical protein